MPTNIVTMIITNGLDVVAISNEIARVFSSIPHSSINWTTIISSFLGILSTTSLSRFPTVCVP